MSSLCRAAVRALGIALIAAAGSSAPATADIYWANSTGTTISRANNDGGGVDPSFVTGATAPRGVTIDGRFVYWAHGGGIGRAELDGTTGKDQGFIATAGVPQGVAVDNAFVYWTNTVPPGDGKIGRANLDGSNPNSSLLPTAASPCGVTADGDKTFWANGGNPGSIGRAHGVFGPDQDFITATSQPCGVAEADGYIYWANRGGDSIGRAKLDGTHPEPSFISTGTGSGPCGVAADGAHVYWTSTAKNAVGRADLDGQNPDPNFISTGAAGPCGIAVSPTARATPSSHAFAATPVGGQSAILSVFVANTSSSVLQVADAALSGPDPGDFEKTGDGCTVNVSPAGQGCVLNVRFSPKAAGMRAAVLRVMTNGSDSPTDIPLTGLATTPTAPKPPNAPDTTPPRFLSASLQPPVLGPHRNVVTLRFSLSEPSRVTITIGRRSTGRRLHGRCVPRTRVNRKRRPCKRFKRVRRSVVAAAAGFNEAKLSRATGKRKLRGGRYRASLVARDEAGNVSKPAFLIFRIVQARWHSG